MEEKENLNYKQAYYYLFNQVTSLITYLKSIQQNCEEICISELPSESIAEVNPSEAIKNLVENIAKNKDCR